MANLLSIVKEERAKFFAFITHEASRASKEAYDGVHTLISHIDYIEQEKERIENNFKYVRDTLCRVYHEKVAAIVEREHHAVQLAEAKARPFLNLLHWLKSKF